MFHSPLFIICTRNQSKALIVILAAIWQPLSFPVWIILLSISFFFFFKGEGGRREGVSDYFFCSCSSSNSNCHCNCTWWWIRFTFRFNNKMIFMCFSRSSKLVQFTLLCTWCELRPLLFEIKLNINRKSNRKLKNYDEILYRLKLVRSPRAL